MECAPIATLFVIMCIAFILLFIFTMVYRQELKETTDELDKTKEKLEIEKLHSTQWRRKYEDTLE